MTCSLLLVLLTFLSSCFCFLGVFLCFVLILSVMTNVIMLLLLLFSLCYYFLCLAFGCLRLSLNGMDTRECN